MLCLQSAGATILVSSFQCSCYHWEYFELYFPPLIQLFLWPLVPLYFLMRLPLDVADHWNCYIYHSAVFWVVFSYHFVWLVGQQLLVCLELENLQRLRSVVLNHQDPETSGPYAAQTFLYTIPATWLCFSVYTVPTCILHLSTWMVFGTSLHSLQLGSCLYGSGALGLFLCFND